jgi:hypothetical protein
MRCKPSRVLVIRTFDCERERAVCLDCGDDMPDWRFIPLKGVSFFYRYISTEDFERGVVPRITNVS